MYIICTEGRRRGGGGFDIQEFSVEGGSCRLLLTDRTHCSMMTGDVGEERRGVASGPGVVEAPLGGKIKFNVS